MPMEITGFVIFLLLVLTISRQSAIVYCNSIERGSNVADDLQSGFNDDHEGIIGELSSVKSAVGEKYCMNRVLNFLNYACARRMDLIGERIRYGCLAPYSFANRICSADDDSARNEVRQLLLASRERRGPNGGAGNSGTGNYPPGFLASRGRRDPTDRTHQREQRKGGTIDEATNGSDDFPNIYVNGFVGSRG